MKRYAVFAHYDQDALVDDYVLYYLRELRTVVDCIIFVSDGDVKQAEQDKLDGLVDGIILGRHQEYDFGSYKRGYAHIQDKLEDGDELILCNDSCFGPLRPFKEMFATMEGLNNDTWGMIIADSSFLMSFFLVIKSTVFTQNYFKAFITSVQKEETKELVVEKYERGISALILKNHGTLHSYMDYCQPSDIQLSTLARLISTNKKNSEAYSDNMHYLLLEGMPFIKKLSFTLKDSYLSINYPQVIGPYPAQLIKSYCDRMHLAQHGLLSILAHKLVYSLAEFLYQSKITKSNKRIIKICKIPVYSRKLRA